MSILERALDDYLRLRRGLGHELADARRLLPSFVAHLDAQNARTVTVQKALTWAQQSTGRGGYSVASRRLTAVRGFARYLAGIDPLTEVPPLGLIPAGTRWRPPFLFSPDDVDALLVEAGRVIGSPLRAATYQTLIGLLAASGLRIGEAIRLDRSDIDWHDGVMLIRESKFGKSRLVPLHPSTLKALQGYEELRDQHQPRPLEPSFFVSLKDKRLLYAVVQHTFRQLVESAGIGLDAPSRPRLHDLRHSFAIHTLLGWYRCGEDVQVKLPVLSTYLGHREPAHTYWYLSASPQLLSFAAARQRTWSAVRS